MGFTLTMTSRSNGTYDLELRINLTYSTGKAKVIYKTKDDAASLSGPKRLEFVSSDDTEWTWPISALTVEADCNRSDMATSDAGRTVFSYDSRGHLSSCVGPDGKPTSDSDDQTSSTDQEKPTDGTKTLYIYDKGW